MRSRDGNSNFILTICSIVFLNIINLYSDEYLISYRYVVKDALLYNENINVSKSMKKCDGVAQESLFIDSVAHKRLESIILDNFDFFLEFTNRLGLEIKNYSTTTNLQNHSTTIVTLKTTCFKVDFNDKFVKIAPLK